MMARVSFGLRGMYLPLFFQLLSNVVFVSTNNLLRGYTLTRFSSVFKRYTEVRYSLLPYEF